MGDTFFVILTVMNIVCLGHRFVTDEPTEDIDTVFVVTSLVLCIIQIILITLLLLGARVIIIFPESWGVMK